MEMSDKFYKIGNRIVCILIVYAFFLSSVSSSVGVYKESHIRKEIFYSQTSRNTLSAETVKDSPYAFEYEDSSQDFKGVDLEHFVVAQNRLAEQELSGKQLKRLLVLLRLDRNIKGDAVYEKIYEALSNDNYTREAVDIINGETYADPRLIKEFIGQNKNPRAQGVYEAVSNGRDALGGAIGQFGKGVKQLADWLTDIGGDRIDVWTTVYNGLPYQLTILRSRGGQNYIRIRMISEKTFQEKCGTSQRNGAVVLVSVREPIPRVKDKDHRNSQEEIIEGIRRRFPFVTSVEIITQMGNDEPQRVNGHKTKEVIAAAEDSEHILQKEVRGKIYVGVSSYTIKIVDNGKGMFAETISRMFVPKQSSKHPKPLSNEAAQKELRKVEVVRDRTLPHRVSFARNEEVVYTADIPEDIINDAVSEGGLMIEGGALFEVPESRDNIIIPLNLKPGEVSNFQLAVEYAVEKIMANSKLSDEDKIKFINTIVLGIEGLAQGNESYEESIKRICANIRKQITGVINSLKQEGYIILPHNREFKKLSVSGLVIYLNKNLFRYKGALTLKEAGGAIVPGVSLGGEKALLLVTMPWKEEAWKGIDKYRRDWHTKEESERFPIIKAEGFIAVPEQLPGIKYLLYLANKRIAKGLNEEENKRYRSLLQMVNTVTAEEIVTSYEIASPKENLKIPDMLRTAEESGAIDVKQVNRFLVKPPVKPSSAPANLPANAEQRYVLMKYGDVVEAGTGMIIYHNIKEMEFIGNGYYKVRVKMKIGSVPIEWFELAKIENGKADVFIQTHSVNEEILFSPDKRFAWIRKEENGTFVGTVFDMQTGKIFYLSTVGFLDTYESLQIYNDLQFSINSKYVVYFSRDKNANKSLIIVEITASGGEIVSGLWLGNYNLEYAINPFANVIFLRDKDTNSMSLIDLSDGEMVVIGVKYLHTDSTGTYTVIVNQDDTMSVYWHKSKKLMKESANNEPIISVSNAYSAGADHKYPKFAVIDKQEETVFVYDEEGNFEDVREMDYFTDGYYTEDIHSEGIFYSRIPGVNVISVYFDSIDPLQRKDKPGAYKHPDFRLFIDNSNPGDSIAIDPVTGEEFQYKGEIIWYEPKSYKLYYYDNEEIFSVNSIDQPESLIKGRGIDNIPARFCIIDGISSYELLDLDSYDSSDTNIPFDYSVVSFDGKYFVFVNPDTGDAAYLDPDEPGNPHFVRFDSSTSVKDEDYEYALKLWKESVISKRDEFIAQARAVYMPLLNLIPEEYRAYFSEDDFAKFADKLYKMQEDEILKRYNAAIEGEKLDLERLPFDIFSKRMQKMSGPLAEYINSAEDIMAQERFEIQRYFYEVLLESVFELGLLFDLTLPDGFEPKTFEVLGCAWILNTQEKVNMLGVMQEFISAFKNAQNGQVAYMDISMITAMLSRIASADSRKALVVRKQLRKLLDKDEAVQNKFLEQLCSAFKKVNPNDIIKYLQEPDKPCNLGAAREFIVFFSNEVDDLKRKEQFIPQGKDIVLPAEGLSLSQIIKLEDLRPKQKGDVVMTMDYLIDKIKRNRLSEFLFSKPTLPAPSETLEAEILKDITVQGESGSYTREIAQNSADANASELIIDYYLQKNLETGKEESVEEAADNGSGMLYEVALIVSQSTKAKGKQIDLGGFFGTGSRTVFEDVDRLEIITKNDKQAYLFGFSVVKDNSGKPTAVKLTRMRKIDDDRVSQGVTGRRIKKAENTIPELDAMLAKRQWKIFSGLAQNENFKIYFINRQGKKEPLVVDYEVLSETDFIVKLPRKKLRSPQSGHIKESSLRRSLPPRRDEAYRSISANKPGVYTFLYSKNAYKNFGKFKIISANDMPLQITDKTANEGRRVKALPDEYLELVPHSLRKYKDELGIIIQIPLPLIRGRTDFEYENEYLPAIQKYAAIEYYKAIVYKALTENFAFENLPMDWETNVKYWNAINLDDSAVTGLADKINSGDYADISEEELRTLLPQPGMMDVGKKFLKLMLLLEVALDKNKPLSKTGMLLRRLAVQQEIDAERAIAQAQRLKDAGFSVGSVPNAAEVPYLQEKVAQGRRLAQDSNITLIEPSEYSEKEQELVELVFSISGNVGLDAVFLAEDMPAPAFFSQRGGKGIIVFDRLQTQYIGKAGSGNVDNLTYIILHENGHLVEKEIYTGPKEIFKDGYIPHDSGITHDSKGTFGEANKLVAWLALANYELPDNLKQRPSGFRKPNSLESVDTSI